MGSYDWDLKNDVVRIIAREVRDFLDATDLASEIKAALTSLSFEIRTEALRTAMTRGLAAGQFRSLGGGAVLYFRDRDAAGQAHQTSISRMYSPPQKRSTV